MAQCLVPPVNGRASGAGGGNGAAATASTTIAELQQGVQQQQQEERDAIASCSPFSSSTSSAQQTAAVSLTQTNQNGIGSSSNSQQPQHSLTPTAPVDGQQPQALTVTSIGIGGSNNSGAGRGSSELDASTGVVGASGSGGIGTRADLACCRSLPVTCAAASSAAACCCSPSSSSGSCPLPPPPLPLPPVPTPPPPLSAAYAANPSSSCSSTTAAATIIPTTTTTINTSGNKRSRSTCSSSSTVSCPTGTPTTMAQRFFQSLPPAGTPLDAQFHELQSTGQMVAVHWHHFMAQATVGNDKDASVLLFDKKCNVKGPARLGRMNHRLGLIDLLRYDLAQLQQLAHPRILRLLHPLTENKEMLAFACEPLQCTLDTLFGQFEPMGGDGGPAPLEKLEMKLGVLQLIEGLSYLHNNAKMLHGNLTPQAVFLTSVQHWKIGGFAFSVAPTKKPNSFPCFPWTKKLPACLQPDLDFLAPEYLEPDTQNVTSAADVFSLGVLICWIYVGGKKLIDVKNNLESYQIVINQLDIALELLTPELDANLKASLAKVLSQEVDQRPAVQMLALTKHFDDPALGALRQLDDLAQDFDPANKAAFLNQTLCSILPQIPEPLWFRRVLRRFEENLMDAYELYPSLLRPLSHMLQHCESHNIHRLRPWFRRIIARAEDKALNQTLLDQMPVIFRRLNDELVEDRCFELLIKLLQDPDPHLKQNAVRALPHIVGYVPGWFVNKRLIPVLQSQATFFQEQIPRQIDLLVAIAHLSDRCDSPTLHYLLTVASVCSTLHPAIVHSKSRLVQRILTCDVSRLRDPLIIAHHLLNPLVLGLALPEMSPAHFDDVMSSSRILLDIIEQLRYESDDSRMKDNNDRRLCDRRVFMSSNHLPRLLITAARPSIGGDGRKMSFLSADGRLEDRSSRRESKDSRCSLESEVSLRICNGSDLSDESALGSSVAGCMAGGAGGGGPSGGVRGESRQFRRKSWLEQGYMHSVSLEQQQCCSSSAATGTFPAAGAGGNQMHPLPLPGDMRANSSVSGGFIRVGAVHQQQLMLDQRPFSMLLARKVPSPKDRLVPARNRSPDAPDDRSKPSRPNSFTNLGHNLACTLWKTFY